MVIDKISATSTRVNDIDLDEFVKLLEFLLFIEILLFEFKLSGGDIDNHSVKIE